MFLRAALVWALGLATAVPYAAYYLLFEAERHQYAGLIIFVGFWIFGYWGVVGPVLSALKIRRVFALLERAHAAGRLAEALRGAETEEVVADLIASENRIPRFVAAWLYRRVLDRLPAAPPASDARTG